MKKIIISILGLLLVSNSYAQFSSSLDVYCYEYDYTDNEGVMSRGSEENKTFIWVNFQKDCMGFYRTTTTLKQIKTTLLNEPYHYDNYAINNLSDTYNRWPGNATTIVVKQMFGGDLPSLYKFYPEFSRKYYTYAKLQKKWTANLDYYYDGTKSISVKDEWNLRANIYSFSTDRKLLFIWDTENPEKKVYYKLVEPSKMKTNLDFLE